MAPTPSPRSPVSGSCNYTDDVQLHEGPSPGHQPDAPRTVHPPGTASRLSVALSAFPQDARLTTLAACLDAPDPDVWFPPTGRSPRAAIEVCIGCPVRAPCLAWALATGTRHGVWGALTQRQLRDVARHGTWTIAAMWGQLGLPPPTELELELLDRARDAGAHHHDDGQEVDDDA